MNLTIEIKGDAFAALRGLDRRLTGAEAKESVGESVRANWANHVRGFKGHQVGSVGFYAQCARSMTARSTSDGVAVDVDRIGFTVRALGTAHLPGGAIFPTGGRKYLTFAANPASYGERARSFTGLKFGFAMNPATGHMQAMLFSPSGSERVSQARNRAHIGRGPSKPIIAPGSIVYWLAKSAKQKGTPALIPNEAQLTKWAGEGVENALIGKGIAP